MTQNIFDTAEFIKEMSYTCNRKCEVLAKGTYLGVDYRIVSYGTHPCAYIKVDETNKFYKKTYDDIPLECHGGLTFSTMFPNSSYQHTDVFSDGYWIGWDYAHYDDYCAYINDDSTTKYTIDDLLNEMQTAIESFIEISK